jgi:hypothetical protein
MSDTVNIKVSADVAQALNSLKAINSNMDEIGKTTKKTTGILTKVRNAITIAFALDKIVGFGAKILETTAKLQAMDAQFDQVFKGQEGVEALKGIGKQSQELSIHADRLKESWSSVNSQLKGAGMEGTKALEATAKATTLAADASAFYDITLEESTAMLQSFMKGNFEAGDAIGVFTSAKQMDGKAMDAYGLKWQDLSEEQRQWLLLDTVGKTYELNGAMGQASREADNWANITGNLKATWERFISDGIGKVAIDLAKDAVIKLTEAIEKLGEAPANIKKAFDEFKEMLYDHREALALTGVAITTFGALIIALNWSAITGAFGLGILALAIGGLTIAEGICATATFLLEGAIAILTAPFAPLIAIIGLVIGAIVYLIFHWEEAKDGAKIVCDGIKEAWDDLFAGQIEFWTNLSTKVNEGCEAIQTTVDGWKEGIAEGFSNAWETVTTGTTEFWTGLSDKINDGCEKAQTKINEWGTNVATAFKTNWDSLLTSNVNMWTNFGTGVVDGCNKAQGKINKFTGDIAKNMDSAWTDIKTKTATKFGEIGTKISEKMEQAKTAVKEAIEKIKSFFKFDWKLPSLKLPKITVKGSFSLKPPSTPSFGISWHKNGGVFDEASVIGVGEAGTEAVVPLTNKHAMSLIGASVAKFMPDGKEKSSSGVVNNFNVQATVREEADISKIAQMLYKLEVRENRRLGRTGI